MTLRSWARANGLKVTLLRSAWNQYRFLLWRLSNRTGPAPSIVKQRTVRKYARAFGTRILVETGTYMGEMIAANASSFSRVYSIELDPRLAAAAKARFRAAPTVTILQGDSGALLKDVICEIHEPCLFWLDAHYSGGITARGDEDTPISRELEIILGHNRLDHVILIDDGRCFDGKNGYPTLETIRELVSAHHVEYEVSLMDDIIRIHQPAHAGPNVEG